MYWGIQTNTTIKQQAIGSLQGHLSRPGREERPRLKEALTDATLLLGEAGGGRQLRHQEANRHQGKRLMGDSGQGRMQGCMVTGVEGSGVGNERRI